MRTEFEMAVVVTTITKATIAGITAGAIVAGLLKRTTTTKV